MGGAKRGGTAEPTSRDQILRQERGQRRENSGYQVPGAVLYSNCG